MPPGAQRMPGLATGAGRGSDQEPGPAAPGAGPRQGPAPRGARAGGRWRVAGLAVVGWLLLFGGILIGVAAGDHRAARPAPAQAPAAAARRPAVVEGARCAQAIARANQALAMAVRVERTLADRSRLRLLEAGGQLTPERARQLDTVAEQQGGVASSRFDALLAGYLEAARGCDPQAR